MEKLYIVDHIGCNDVEQYGDTKRTYEEAIALFKEAVHAYNLDDYWNGLAGVAEDPDDCSSLVIREIVVP